MGTVYSRLNPRPQRGVASRRLARPKPRFPLFQRNSLPSTANFLSNATVFNQPFFFSPELSSNLFYNWGYPYSYQTSLYYRSPVQNNYGSAQPVIYPTPQSQFPLISSQNFGQAYIPPSLNRQNYGQSARYPFSQGIAYGARPALGPVVNNPFLPGINYFQQPNQFGGGRLVTDWTGGGQISPGFLGPPI